MVTGAPDLSALTTERDRLAERVRNGHDRLKSYYAEHNLPLARVIGTEHWRKWTTLLAEYERLCRIVPEGR